MIGICLSSVSVVPASAAAWNLSSPPLNFVRRVFQCHFEQGITQRNASRKPFLLRHSTSTQRLFRSSACQILTTAWRALFNLPSASYAAYLQTSLKVG